MKSLSMLWSVGLMLIAFYSQGMAQPLQEYSVQPYIFYHQTNGNPAILNEVDAFVLQVDVKMAFAGAYSQGTIQGPSGKQVKMKVSGDAFSLRYKSQSLAQMDQDWGTGEFIFHFTNATGTDHLPIRLQGNTYPNAPQVLNWQAMLNVVAGNYSRINWSPMTNGTANDFIQLRIENIAGDKVYETPDFRELGALDGRAVTTLIPPGKLETNETYIAFLLFRKLVTIDETTVPGAVGFSSYGARTRFLIHTLATQAQTADVESFGVLKGHLNIQDSSTGPRLEPVTPFSFDVKVKGSASNLVKSASVELQDGTIMPLIPDIDTQKFDFVGRPATETFFNARYPEGSYKVTMQTVHGQITVPLDLTTDYFPPAPEIKNFDSLQHFDADQDLTISWGTWPNHGPNDIVQLKIDDDTGRKVFETADPPKAKSFGGGLSSVVIPAGIMYPGRTYRGTVYFLRVTDLEAEAYPGAIGYAGHYAQTKFNLKPIADVTLVSIVKGARYYQVNSTNVSAPKSGSFFFESTVGASGINRIALASFSHGVTTNTMQQMPGNIEFQTRRTFDALIRLEQQYSSGQYDFAVNPVHEGAKSFHVLLPAMSLIQPVRLLDYAALQNFDPAGATPIEWITPSGSTAHDVVQLEIRSKDGQLVFVTPGPGQPGALNGQETLFWLPPSTLTTNALYQAAITFYKISYQPVETYPAAVIFSALAARTEFDLATRGDNNPPQISFESRVGENAFRLNLAGLPGQTFQIESSQDLSHWTPYQTNVFINTSLTFTQEVGVLGDRQFFRMKTLPTPK